VFLGVPLRPDDPGIAVELESTSITQVGYEARTVTRETGPGKRRDRPPMMVVDEHDALWDTHRVRPAGKPGSSSMSCTVDPPGDAGLPVGEDARAGR